MQTTEYRNSKANWTAREAVRNRARAERTFEILLCEGIWNVSGHKVDEDKLYRVALFKHTLIIWFGSTRFSSSATKDLPFLGNERDQAKNGTRKSKGTRPLGNSWARVEMPHGLELECSRCETCPIFQLWTDRWEQTSRNRIYSKLIWNRFDGWWFL